MKRPAKVGIRELRQNLSVYVKAVREEGQAYEVTERGEPVARLLPLADRAGSTWERLIADGRVSVASRPWSSVPPPVKLSGTSLSELLQRMRDEEPR